MLKQLLIGVSFLGAVANVNATPVNFWDPLEPHVNNFQGFSVHEGTHRWTDQNLTSFDVPLNAGPNGRWQSIILNNLHGFVHANFQQNVTVQCNGIQVHQFIATAVNNDHTFVVNFPAAPANVATLTFTLPNAITPMSIGLGEDPRLLGLSFGTATLH